MREIKFRAKERSGEWVVGSLFVEDGMGITYILSGVNTHYETNYLEVEVVSDTVGQFTGLRDADGREIYEGDIVSWGDGMPPTSVRWDEHFAYYVIMESLILSHACKAVRVIGNIYDNPELLEVKDTRD